MIRSHKIRLKPTKMQEEFFRRACGTSRFAYNWALAQWKQERADGGKPNEAKLRKKLNAIKRGEFPWMVEVGKVAVQQAVKNLGTAYKNAFARLKTKQKRGRKNPFGFPQFKRRGEHDSFRADNGPQDKQSSAVVMNGKSIRLPKCGAVRMREAVRFSGRILSATVSRMANGWYVSLQVETCQTLQQSADACDAVGVDLGVRSLATLSTGEHVRPPKNIRLLRGKMTRLSRSLSRKVKGSRNRTKAKTKLARLHLRIANVRKDALHKLTHKLATQFKLVAIEDLNVSGMLKNRKLARAVSECGFFEFRRQLQYKCDMTGTQLVVVDRWFPSSKTCNCCGWINKQLPQVAEKWRCDSCDTFHDRDINAAINLVRQALPDFKPVERSALAVASAMVKPVSMKQEVTGLSRNA